MPLDNHEAFRDLPVSDDQDIISLKFLPALELSDSPSVPQKHFSSVESTISLESFFFKSMSSEFLGLSDDLELPRNVWPFRWASLSSGHLLSLCPLDSSSWSPASLLNPPTT